MSTTKVAVAASRDIDGRRRPPDNFERAPSDDAAKLEYLIDATLFLRAPTPMTQDVITICREDDEFSYSPIYAEAAIMLPRQRTICSMPMTSPIMPATLMRVIGGAR